MQSVIDRSQAPNPSSTVPPIGQLLVVGEYIMPQDLEFALEHQKFCNNLIGEILVRMGALNRKDLDTVLRTQKFLISR